MASIERISADRSRPIATKIRIKAKQGSAPQNVISVSAFVLTLVFSWYSLGATAFAQAPGTDNDSFAIFIDEIVEKSGKATDSASGRAEGLPVRIPVDPLLVDETLDDQEYGAEGRDPLPPPPSIDGLPSESLTLADVVASLYRSYPEIVGVRFESNRTDGELMAAYGAFDTKLNAHTISEPTGYYENYRHGIGAARETWWGGYLAAGYRIGRDDFQPWYKERQTDEGGEFKIAIGQALIQGRAIDANRVAVFQASLSRRIVDPMIQQAILDSAGQAADLYWHWVASGIILQAQEELLDLAVERGKQYELGVEAGKFAEIDLILNQQLIAERRSKRLLVQQRFQETAIKLGIFLRDEAGQPLIAQKNWLPAQFPAIVVPRFTDRNQELAEALARRPEPRILQLQIQQIQVERRLHDNNTLPQVDLIVEASQDVGKAATLSDDKSEFELILGLQAEVPIQRRKARGKLRAATAKIAQSNQKLRLQHDKIAAELQAAHNRLTMAEQILEQSEISLRAAFESLNRYRFAFESGKIDLIYLNFLETKFNETEIILVEAQRDWFQALASLQITLGLDPLEQAIAVAQLSDSDRPGPGRLPPPQKLDRKSLERDWQLHDRTNP